MLSKLENSKSEIRRLIKGNGIKINNQSIHEFENWLKEWSSFQKIALKIEKENLQFYKKPKQEFTIINTSEINNDQTFLIQLKPNKNTKFESGDLLSITPKNGSRSRLYSIAKIDTTILLSIKKHKFGLCSNFLNSLNKGSKIEANIQKNEKFRFSKKAKEVILIANGTGIAPFLGMIHGKKSKTKVHLFWGGRTKQSLEIYQNYINTSLKKKHLHSFNAAFSQEQKEKIYVQDILLNKRELIANTLKNGDVIMICGSISMQKAVIKVLEELSKNHLQTSLKKFEENNQILTDCY